MTVDILYLTGLTVSMKARARVRGKKCSGVNVCEDGLSFSGSRVEQRTRLSMHDGSESFCSALLESSHIRYEDHFLMGDKIRSVLWDVSDNAIRFFME